jgi:hypothetical protein
MITPRAVAPAAARDAYRSNTYGPFSIVSVMSRTTQKRGHGPQMTVLNCLKFESIH